MVFRRTALSLAGTAVELTEDRPRDRHPIDPVGERPADELVPERGVPAGAEAEREVIEGASGCRRP